jgi:hypothetical protein
LHYTCGQRALQPLLNVEHQEALRAACGVYRVITVEQYLNLVCCIRDSYKGEKCAGNEYQPGSAYCFIYRAHIKL